MALALAFAFASFGCKHKLATIDVTTDGAVDGAVDEEADDDARDATAPSDTADAGPIDRADGSLADMSDAHAPDADATVADAGPEVAPAGLAMAPTSKDYGIVVTGTFASADFDISNPGGQATGVPSATLVGNDAAQFSVAATTCTAALAAGAHCTVTVRFSPTVAGAKRTQLTVTATPGGTATADLSGSAITPAVLSIAPVTKDFSIVVQGSTASADFEVSNLGMQTTGVPSAALAGNDASQFAVTGSTCTVALAAGERCTVSVRFSATLVGARQAQLTVMATPGGTATATLAGTVVTAGLLSITPANAAFTPLLPGATSAVSSFTIRNGGGAVTGPLTTAIVGSTEFKIMGNTCAGVALASMATCTIGVILMPTTPGPESATLTVTATPGGTVSASLTGTALHPALLTITPTTFTFSGTEVNTSSATRGFSITNSGDVAAGTTTALSTVLGGTNAADFPITSNTCTGTLGASGTCQVVLGFDPAAAGNRAATLTVSATPGGPAIATIAGTGLRPPSITGSPTTMDFGSLVIGVQSAAKTWTITNGGDVATGALTFMSSNTSEIVATNNCTASLAGGAQCTISVSVKLSGGGARSGTLTLAGARGGTATLSVTATGTGVDGQACTTGAQCGSGVCNKFYVDADGDHYGAGSQVGFCTITTPPTGYATIATDCCDSNAMVNPGVNTFHATAASSCPGGTMVSTWDWNCSGAIEADLQNAVSCGPPTACVTSFGSYPDTSCGNPNVAPQACTLVNEGGGVMVCEIVQSGPTEADRLRVGLGGLGVLGCM